MTQAVLSRHSCVAGRYAIAAAYSTHHTGPWLRYSEYENSPSHVSGRKLTVTNVIASAVATAVPAVSRSRRTYTATAAIASRVK